MESHRQMRGSIRRGLLFLCGGTLAALVATRSPAADPDTVTSAANTPAEAGRPSPRAGGDVGLILSRAPEVLCEQLALESGTGLVVDAVAAGSIAAQAGIRRHDVVVSLGDLPIAIPEQMAGLVAASAEEPPLRCRVFRGGRALSISLPVRLPPGRSLGEVPAASFRPAANHRPAHRGRTGLLMRVANETLLQQDADYHIKVTNRGETRLFVRDSRGLTVYNGAIDTPEQRSLMPIAIRDRVERMERLLESPPSVGSLDPHLAATPTSGDRGPSAAGSGRRGLLESPPEKAAPERMVSHAEPQSVPASSGPSVGERRPPGSRQPDDGGARPDIEIGRLEIEPVEIR